jgi:hypothetical protein
MASSTFDNASIFITPSGYKASFLYPTKPLGTADFSVTRATTAYRTNASGILESVASGVPRLDYPAAGGCPALLVEPAATNLFRASEPAVDPGQGVRTNITFEANTWNVGLSGSVIFEDNAVNRIYQNTASLSGAHTLFFLAKRTDNGVVSDADIRGMFNNSGVVTTFTLWKDNIYIGRAFAGSVSGASNGVFKDASRTANRVEVSAIMIVAGDVQLSPSSYIKTTGATATRNADVINKTGVSGFIGQTEGTVYAEVDLSRVNTNPLIVISDGGDANRIQISFLSATSLFATIRVAGASANYSVTIPTIPAAGGVYKMALGYKVNDYCFALNGTTYADTSSRAVPACNKIGLGTSATELAFLNDRIRAAAIYTTRLTDSELAALTTL